MDFTLSPRGEEYRSRIRAFVERELIPLEEHADSYDEHENISLALLQTMRARARQQGLWCLQLPAEWGGQGLGIMEMAACYEEMNRYIFGAVVFNSAAHDDGHMLVVSKVSTQAQKERWFRPIANDDVQSSFATSRRAEGREKMC